MRRQDVNLRNLVNRTLQYLYVTGKLNEIHQKQFRRRELSGQSFVVWSNVGAMRPSPISSGRTCRSRRSTSSRECSRTPAARRRAGRSARRRAGKSAAARCGQSGAGQCAGERWQVTVVPVAGGNPVDLVASGAADLAVGITAGLESRQSGRFQQLLPDARAAPDGADERRLHAALLTCAARSSAYFLDDAGCAATSIKAQADRRQRRHRQILHHFARAGCGIYAAGR